MAKADAIYHQGMAELEAALKASCSFDDLKSPYLTIAQRCGQLSELGAKELSERLRRELETRLESQMNVLKIR